jgi:HK97 gp10 family phage protein
MGNITVRLEGEEAVMRRLQQLGLSVSAVLEGAVRAAAELVRDDARGMAPGPEIELDTLNKTQRRVEVGVGPDDEHWYYKFLETGTGAHAIHGSPMLVFMGDEGLVMTPGVDHPGMAARPFLRPAMDANEGPATTEMGRRWRGAIE